MNDQTDYSQQNNTPLDDNEHQAFLNWAKQKMINVPEQLKNYDIQGFYKSGLGQSENGHFTDEFKKPNHPTFSDQSIYSNPEQLSGGHWNEDSFTPSNTNMIFNSPQNLENYFNKVEPETQLDFSKLRQKFYK